MSLISWAMRRWADKKLLELNRSLSGELQECRKLIHEAAAQWWPKHKALQDENRELQEQVLRLQGELDKLRMISTVDRLRLVQKDRKVRRLCVSASIPVEMLSLDCNSIRSMVRYRLAREFLPELDKYMEVRTVGDARNGFAVYQAELMVLE